MGVSLDQIGTRLTDVINDYAIEVQEEVLKRFELTADEILDYVKNNCPRSDGFGYSHHLFRVFYY